MKQTAQAPSNIAIIKYWGKKNSKLDLPFSSTISINYNNLFTQTTVEFNPKLQKDAVTIDGKSNAQETKRVSTHLDIIRKLAKIKTKAKVVSKNNFPKSSGLASSASGFAALTAAGAKAAGLNLKEKQLTALARLGSGSASRSIPSGFVKWEKGTNHQTSYARSLYPASYWNLDILVIIVNNNAKKTSSTQGHSAAVSSPFFNIRTKNLDKKIKKIESALKSKNFKLFGQTLETEALELHAIALTSIPPIIYWEPKSIQIMKLCHALRQKDIDVYFTFDAGPQPVLFCQQKDTPKVMVALKSQVKDIQIIKSKPGEGTTITSNHLF